MVLSTYRQINNMSQQMKSTNKHYEKLTSLANNHIEKLKSNNETANEQTLAAIMFIKSHKNYLRYLALNNKICNRQHSILEFVKDNIGSFNYKDVKWELTKIGIVSSLFVYIVSFIFFTLLYLIIVPTTIYTSIDEPIMGIYILNMIIGYISYVVIACQITSFFILTRIPLYFYKKY